MITTCYCVCGWPVRTNVTVEIECPMCGEQIKCISGSVVSVVVFNPPFWVRALQWLSVPDDIGLGATVKRVAAKYGGERFKAWSKRIGLPCGCTDRELEWNRLYPNPNYKE